MIPRYARPEMAAIWTAESRFRIWFEIEAHACDALVSLGVMPREDAEAVWQAGEAGFDTSRIDEIEAVTKHDVIAFLTHLSELAGENSARFVHQGMTSSDILDTCFNVQLARACDLLSDDIRALLAALRKRALDHKYTPCIGRSHGVHAEPTTFGLKMAQAYAEMSRNLCRLAAARDEIAVGAISGAVGTFAHIDPSVEAHVCKAMGLAPEAISTQIIPRDRHAAFFSALAVVASSVERISTEIRHLQRTEVLEVEEAFAAGQKGSSAMPHKRNPVLSENLTGLSRLVRMAAAPAMENVTLWHERDISHSSVERVIGPDATIALDFALVRLTGVISGLVVHSGRMASNLDHLRGLVHSQRILLGLVERGQSREDAYRLVQRNAMKVWDEGTDFKSELKSDPDISAIMSDGDIDACFDIEYHLRHVDMIFERVFGQDSSRTNG